jgi:hypothetical protein
MKEPGINPAIQETRQDNRQFLLVVSFFFHLRPTTALLAGGLAFEILARTG